MADPDRETKNLPGAANRILAQREGRRAPLIQNLVGPASPSPSLLIERGEVFPSDWDHVLEDQVITLFLKPATLLYAPDGQDAMELQVAPGQVVIGSRNSPESIRWQDKTSILSVRVANGALDDAAHATLGRDRPALKATTHADDSRITNLLYTLDAERALGYPAGPLLLDSIETSLAALLVTSHEAARSMQANWKGGLAPQRLRRAVSFMHDNITREVTLGALAASAGISPSHFSHQFRLSMGVGPYHYFQRLRIERAKELLRNRLATVVDVALALGFSSQQHFSTVFRQVVGYSPSEFRRRT
jgi:AraC family transcriptional regulator